MINKIDALIERMNRINNDCRIASNELSSIKAEADMLRAQLAAHMFGVIRNDDEAMDLLAREAIVAEADLATAMDALKKIASCESHHPDDVVSVARATLARLTVSRDKTNDGDHRCQDVDDAVQAKVASAESLIAAAVEAEREACLQCCRDHFSQETISAAIRARKLLPE